MSSQGIAVQDRLGDTTDHVMPPGDKPAQRGGGPFLYASGTRPLSGYVIKRGVGSGGFGEVYYATSDAGKEVALKLIRRNLDTELRGMRQCLNLKHPNLLSLYDIRQDDSGDTWVVMEYMSGRSLEVELADHPQGLPLQEALAWFRGIAAGVANLHDHGIVHRDLKPGNIFCDEGVVKVGDYGLSKFISCSRRSGHTESIGTVHYMAPEVAHGRYGKELDIYALGAILYELLTGHVPFDGESVGEVLMKHLTAQPDVSKLAEPYRSVVVRALEKDPTRRFATVSEMLAALPVATAAAAYPLGGAQAAGGSGPSPTPNRPTSPMPASPQPAYRPTASAIPGESVDGFANQEPIARAVRQQFAQARHAWRKMDLPKGFKILILIGGFFALLKLSHFLIPLALFLTGLYICYWIARTVYLAFFGAPKGRRAGIAGPGTTQTPRQKPVPPEPVTPVFVVKPLAVRVTDLIGSLLVAAAVTATMCVVMLVIEAYRGMQLQMEQCAWLYLVSLAGAWFVLTIAKFWEGTRGERMLRHFILMTVGFGLGLVAYGVADVFLVQLPVDPALTNHMHRAGPNWVPSAFYHDGRPMAMAYVAAFATLLAVLRWWLDADPMRGTRLSLWSLLVTVGIACGVANVWQFPEPWLMMVAACMSVAVQLSSPWVPIYDRLHPQRKKTV